MCIFQSTSYDSMYNGAFAIDDVIFVFFLLWRIFKRYSLKRRPWSHHRKLRAWLMRSRWFTRRVPRRLPSFVPSNSHQPSRRSSAFTMFSQWKIRVRTQKEWKSIVQRSLIPHPCVFWEEIIEKNIMRFIIIRECYTLSYLTLRGDIFDI